MRTSKEMPRFKFHQVHRRIHRSFRDMLKRESTSSMTMALSSLSIKRPNHLALPLWKSAFCIAEYLAIPTQSRTISQVNQQKWRWTTKHNEIWNDSFRWMTCCMPHSPTSHGAFHGMVHELSRSADNHNRLPLHRESFTHGRLRSLFWTKSSWVVF